MQLRIDEQSFVLYRLPRATEIELLRGETVACKDIPKGKNFVFADFDGNRYCFDKPLHQTFRVDKQLQDLVLDFDYSQLKVRSDEKSTLESDYINQVTIAIESIQKEDIHKVVFSKIKILKNHISDLKQSFLSLCNAYSETFVCLCYTPKFGLWVGASPEVLLESNHEHIRTVALAGTQQNMGKETKDATWSQKEIEEQALVSRFIINCFKKLRLREYEERGPKTILTGKLFHLKTDYLIKKNEVDIQELEAQLLDLLHPTSAVCGMPKEEAKAMILAHEKHQRRLYTGFWGPTFDAGFKLFVNIRLVQVFQEQLVYYAGAGITEDSNPIAEWAETEAKCDNLATKLLN